MLIGVKFNMYVCEKPNENKITKMRRIYYLFIAGALVFGVTSCNEKKEKEATETQTEKSSTTEATDKTEGKDVEVALNPPHGQPGHVCEIPVGQPLPGGNTTSATNNSSESGQKLNPPHGQPGHVCEIPVGQPLPNGGSSSAPAGNVKLQTPLMKNNEKLNPPHGQPGHVCEIPVGQPLP